MKRLRAERAKTPRGGGGAEAPERERESWLDGPVTLTPRETKDGTVWTLTTALNLAAELPAVKGQKKKAVTPKASCGGGI